MPAYLLRKSSLQMRQQVLPQPYASSHVIVIISALNAGHHEKDDDQRTRSAINNQFFIRASLRGIKCENDVKVAAGKINLQDELMAKCQRQAANIDNYNQHDIFFGNLSASGTAAS